MATACSPGLSSLATEEGALAEIFESSELGCKIVCSSNCISCAINGAAKCDVCKDEFTLDTTSFTCADITEAMMHYTCLRAKGTSATDC